MVQLDWLVRLMECETQEEWGKLLFEIANHYGYEKTIFGVVPNRHVSIEPVFLQSNYSGEWRNKYDAEKFHYLDPTVSHCVRSSLPLIWQPKTFNESSQQAFYEEACSYGIRSGITYPIHGAGGESGLISFASDRMAKKDFLNELAHALPDLALVRDYAFESSQKFTLLQTKQEVHLTPREVECLKWAMEGKTAWEISIIMHCSEDTVNFHFKNLRRKFNVNTRQQVVVKAIRLGIILPD